MTLLPLLWRGSPSQLWTRPINMTWPGDRCHARCLYPDTAYPCGSDRDFDPFGATHFFPFFAGKAVFCEKPVSENTEGTKACYEAAESASQPLLCSFNRSVGESQETAQKTLANSKYFSQNMLHLFLLSVINNVFKIIAKREFLLSQTVSFDCRRFDPALKHLKKRVKAGDCGKVHVVKTCARDHPLPPLSYLKISGGPKYQNTAFCRVSFISAWMTEAILHLTQIIGENSWLWFSPKGGLFHDCAVHDIDLVCWILGEYPNSVFAQGHAHNKDIREMGDVDTTLIQLAFPSGALASIDLSRNANYGYDQRCEVRRTSPPLHEKKNLDCWHFISGWHEWSHCRCRCSEKTECSCRRTRDQLTCISMMTKVLIKTCWNGPSRRDTRRVTRRHWTTSLTWLKVSIYGCSETFFDLSGSAKKKKAVAQCSSSFIDQLTWTKRAIHLRPFTFVPYLLCTPVLTAVYRWVFM